MLYIRVYFNYLFIFFVCDHSDNDVQVEGENLDNGVENPVATDEMDVNQDKGVENQGPIGGANAKGNICVKGDF